jgi:ABC-type dipeptide/oligopeptide/nickel transport system permease component
MLQFLIRRILGLVFVVLSVTFITFLMGLIAPGGDPVSVLLGIHNTPQEHAILAHQYGLDLPWYQQYANFLVHMLQGNFGFSYAFKGQPVSGIIGPAVQVSVVLGLVAFVVALLLGIPAGIIAALRRNTWTDSMIMGVMLLLYAIPAFVIIPFFQAFMDYNAAHGLPYLPTSQWTASSLTGDFFADIAQYRIAPIVILAFTEMGYYARLTRTVMLEVLGQDYVRTARAKGLSERAVVYIHTLRNALLPLLSVIGPSLAYLVSGAFVIEFLLSIPGVGFQGVHAVTLHDWPVLQYTVVLLAIAVVVMNLLTDIAYSVVDPRIRIAA